MAFLDSLYPFPMNAVRGGQQVEAGFAQAEQEGEAFHQAMRDKLALRKAAANMGKSNYFTGYEGVEGAERPDYLKQLYAEGDPDAAIKLEQLQSEPFKIQRSIETAGKIEAAKKAADLKNNIAMMDYFMGPGGGSGIMDQAGAPPAAGPMPVSTEGAQPTGGPPVTNAFSLSGRERGIKMTPQGPQFEIKDKSPAELASIGSTINNQQNEMTNRDTNTKLALSKEQRAAINEAHTESLAVKKEIGETHKAIQNRDITPEEGEARLQELNDLHREINAELEGLVRGKDPAAAATERPAPTNIPSPQAPAPRATPPAGAAGGKLPASLSPGQAGSSLTYKEKGALAVKDAEEKTTASNKEIVNARLGAEKMNKFKRQMDELFKIVTKEDIGHPAMEGVPGAANVLSLNRSNAQVKKLNEALTNMFAEPGQSQMMNTIVERQMQGAVVPSLFADPQINKVNAAILKSNMEHLSNFPSFLEKWHKSHKGSLDGATDAWIDYTDNNPIYTYDRDVRGRVTVKENPNVMPVDKWTKMRAEGKVRNIGKDVYIQGPDKSWSKK